MSIRELVVLGTASQAPTRARNHNGYLLRWDGEGILFDPGEGTQRQLTMAGAAATDINRICITHFHGDHCLGLPGIVQRLSLDRVTHPVEAYFPASGAQWFTHLRYASIFHETVDLRECPITDDGPVATGLFGTLEARRLDHRVDTFGYRLVEPDGRRLLPERLAAVGVAGPQIGRLQRAGSIEINGTTVRLDEVSEVRRGQRFALVMDTRLCDAVFTLADGADLLVIEATYLDRDSDLAQAHAHLTAAQAARVAAECGVHTLVLTHFSQRYDNPDLFLDEASKHFDGTIVIAEDLTRIPLPPRTQKRPT
jgi:ribonuclease Z